MAIYGYHRVSTKEQHADRGIFEIEEYCKTAGVTLNGEIFCDRQTGKNFNRPEYAFIRNRIQSGDTLIITEMDRLGRNKAEILKELQFFRDKGVYVIILEVPTTQQDFSKMENTVARLIMETINNMLIEMYAVFAQVEIEKKEKRQREGIDAKKRRGEWDDYGRPRKVDLAVFKPEYEKVLRGELRPSELQRRLGLSSTTYYRYVKQYTENSG
jgi:DNA invertase Pin-like site-specific DNA recombinase